MEPAVSLDTQSKFVTLETAAMHWQPAGTSGFWKKELHNDVIAGRSTSLVRIDPGGNSLLHSHQTREQVFVLEGAFSDQTRTYRPGDFVVRGPGIEHTATSESGSAAADYILADDNRKDEHGAI